MRPIDADALLLKALEEKRFIFSYEDALNQELVMETVYHDLAEFILSAPVLDAVSVRHGRWIDCSNGWMCSECGQDNTYDKPYCPNCGAKMDLKGD